MYKGVWWFSSFTNMVTHATGAIARFSNSLAALLILAGYGLLRRRALPESPKNAHSHPSNCRF
jgi:hypothetical protein